MSNPFRKSTTPNCSLELLQWLIFEPILFKNYEKTLTKNEILIITLKATIINFFVVIIPLTLLLYAISVIIIAVFDLPLIFPPDISKNIDANKVFVQQWQTYLTWWEKTYFFISFNDYNSLIELERGLELGFKYSLVISVMAGLGLMPGLVSSFAIGLLGPIACLAVGLASGLTVGLAYDLTSGLSVGLGTGLVLGLTFCLVVDLLGLAKGLAFGLTFGLLWSLVVGLALGLAVGLVEGLTGGLTLLLFFYLTYFRLWFYPWHFLKSLVNVNLIDNPYVGDGTIWLPIWGMAHKLAIQAQQYPKTGLALVDFLLEYRPLQKRLAMHIAHAATAGNWQHHPLKKQYLSPPSLIQETSRLMPSTSWLNQIEKLNQQFKTYEDEKQISLKKLQWETFCKQLSQFRGLTTSQPYRWHRYYLSAIDKWQIAAQEKLVELTQEAKNQEPITQNIYRLGDILDPNEDKDIFFGREDIKEELEQQILTARTMPLFLCYGQRRVGKSSLLKFLPRLLNNRFRVIYQDCQSAKVSDLLSWLQDLQQCLEQDCGETAEIDWQATDNWLMVWEKMQHYLETFTDQREEKIILAFDEYEELHKRIFSENPKQAGMLLSAMRSFSQQQNQIVFLFVGATQFADLKNPNWAQYFVHAIPLKVDYLSKEQTTRLITEPVNLNYPPAVIERMWAVTQGHPGLLQMLCRYMVNIANIELRKNMTLTDLEQVITEKIVQRHTYALSAFWEEFCEQHKCHATIEEIIANQPITEQLNLFKLEDYGYIIPTGESWKLRVPLLEMWLREYRD